MVTRGDAPLVTGYGAAMFSSNRGVAEELQRILGF
jgi:hypothetical protein